MNDDDDDDDDNVDDIPIGYSMSIRHTLFIGAKVLDLSTVPTIRDLYTISTLHTTTNKQLKTSIKSNVYSAHRFDHVKSPVLSLGTI